MAWQETELHCLLTAILLMASSVFSLEIHPKGKLVQAGRLVLSFNGAGAKTEDGFLRKMHDEYVGDTNGYQADQPASMGSQMAMLRLRRLSPSVQCDHDSMLLHIKGSQVPNLMVETSEEGPVPLSQMPSDCGFSVRRAGRDLSLSTNYDCHNVNQQGNAYILPLHFFGLTVKVVCPRASPIANVLCGTSSMIANLPTSLVVLRVKVNGVWQPLSQVTNCGFTWKAVSDGLTLTAPYSSKCLQLEAAEMRLSVHYPSVELTLSCPVIPSTTPTPTTTIAPAGDQPAPYHWVPGMYYPYFMPWHFQHGPPQHFPVAPTTTMPPAPTTTTPPPTTTMPPTTTPAPTTTMPPTTTPAPTTTMPPTTTPAPTTTMPPTTTPAPTTTMPPTTTPAPTTTMPPTTTPAPTTTMPPTTTPAPTTTMPPTTTLALTTTMPPTTTLASTVAPASADNPVYPWLPGMYHPHFRPWHFQHGPPAWYGHGMPWHFPCRHSGALGVVPPTTTQTTMTTTTTAAPAHGPYFYPWLPGMSNPSVAFNDVSKSRPNSGFQQQMMPWMNTFSKNQHMRQLPGFPAFNPSNAVPHPANLFPLQVKAGP